MQKVLLVELLATQLCSAANVVFATASGAGPMALLAMAYHKMYILIGVFSGHVTITTTWA